MGVWDWAKVVRIVVQYGHMFTARDVRFEKLMDAGGTAFPVISNYRVCTW